MTANEKKQLRQQVLTYLTTLIDTPEKQERETALQDALMKADYFQNAQVIGAYLPNEVELSLKKVLQKVQEDKKILVLPKAKNKKMTFHVFNDETKLVYSNFGVLEPEDALEIEKKDIDLLIVPGLVYRKDGYRIGFGGGYYDRYLEDFKGETVSLLLKEQLQEFTPEKHDIPISNILVR